MGTVGRHWHGTRSFRSVIAVASALSLVIGFYSVSSAVSDDAPQDDAGYSAATAQDVLSTTVDDQGNELRLITYQSASGRCLDVLVVEQGSMNPTGLVGSCGERIALSLRAIGTGLLAGALPSTAFEVVSGRIADGKSDVIMFVAGGVAACEPCDVRLTLKNGQQLVAPVRDGVFVVTGVVGSRSPQPAAPEAQSTANRRNSDVRVATAELRAANGDLAVVRTNGDR